MRDPLELRHPLRWMVGFVIVLALGVGGAAQGLGHALVPQVEAEFGRVDRDRRLDSASEIHDAEVMTSELINGRWLVSYEYFIAGEIFVGYVWVPHRVGRSWPFGTRIPVEVYPAQPELTRPQGLRLAPRAWITEAYTRWLSLQPWVLLGGALLGCVVWVLVGKFEESDGE